MDPARSRNTLPPAENITHELLSKLAGDSVRFDEPMSRHTTLKIGGLADAWFEPRSIDQLSSVVTACAERGIPITPVGGGSNLLVRDGGLRGVALSTRSLREIERQGESGIRAQAGVSTGKLLSMATRWQLGGVEFLGGVPGSIGGGLVMNAGTYLGEFKDVTSEVSSVGLADGQRIVRTNEACQFRYRASALPTTEVVVEASFDLTPTTREDIQRVVRQLRQRRNEREPKKVSNAGSVFKNPTGDYAGRLIEAVGLKGMRIGNAECSAVHANWFVNVGGATAADMLELIKIARAKVAEHHGIALELEWKIIGED